MLIEKGLEVIGAFLKEAFIEELLSQNHIATGEHIKSIKFQISQGSSGFELAFSSNNIIVDKALNNGTKAGRYVPISALMEWIEAKGIATGDKEVKSIAFAIRQKIFKEGTPTKNSQSKFNKKNWIDITIKNNKAEISSKLAFIVSESVNTSLSVLAKDINSVK
jgi:hypothetical protein